MKKAWMIIMKLNRKKQEDKIQLKWNQITIRKQIMRIILVNWIMAMMRICNKIK